MSKLSDEGEKEKLAKLGNEYRALLLSHAMHIGYAISYNVETDADMERFVEEIKEMLG